MKYFLTYFKRLLVVPFVFFIYFVNFFFATLLICKKFLLNGGEIMVYKSQESKNTIADVYDKLEKLLENDQK